MAKLTRDQRSTLERMLYDMERAHGYVMGSDLALCIRDKHATTTLHYSRKSDGAILYEVAKHSSHLVGLECAMSSLRRMLAPAAPLMVEAD